MARGKFISYEGSEGCGKSTQIRILRERLEAAGEEVHLTREPGGTACGEAIRHLLQFSEDGHGMSPETELLLFAASRAQLVREVVDPALARGVHVIADRFLDSTTVYQGVGRKLDPGDVEAINRFAVGGRLPDVTFVLDLDTEEARRRMMRRVRPVDERDDRMESEPLEFYERVRAGYLALAKSEPGRIHVIDADQPADAVAGEISRELENRFHGIFSGQGV